MAALPHTLEKATAPGARPSSAAFNPVTDHTPVSITQIRRPIFDRLGAGKNARAPARAGKGNGPGSAAVPGRINPTTDLTPVSITQIRRPIFDRLGIRKLRVCPHVWIS